MTPTRASLLAFRRTLRERAAERSQSARRGVPVALPPSGALSTYTGFLEALVKDLHDATREALKPYGVSLPARLDGSGERVDADTDEPYLKPEHVASIERDLRAVAQRLAKDPTRLTIFSRVAQGVTAHTREQWARQVKALIGIDLPKGDPDLRRLMDRFRRENTDLITSLTKEHVERVHETLKDAGSGTRVEVIRKRIMEQTGAVRSRAALIARDQVLSLNAEVTQERHKSAGVTEYVWRTSRDERVREAHKDLDGTRHRYDDPPVVDARTGRREHPGQDFQCRCTAEPVIPGFDSV